MKTILMTRVYLPLVGQCIHQDCNVSADGVYNSRKTKQFLGIPLKFTVSIFSTTKCGKISLCD